MQSLLARRRRRRRAAASKADGIGEGDARQGGGGSRGGAAAAALGPSVSVSVGTSPVARRPASCSDRRHRPRAHCLPSPRPQSSLSAVAAARHRCCPPPLLPPPAATARRRSQSLTMRRRHRGRCPPPPAATAAAAAANRRRRCYRLWLDRALNQQSRQYPALLPTCILIAGRLLARVPTSNVGTAADAAHSAHRGKRRTSYADAWLRQCSYLLHNGECLAP